jgi:hypothetical protein
MLIREYRYRGGVFGVISKVEIAYEGCEEGLEGIEEDGKFEELRCISRSVRSGGQALLQ